MHSRILSSCLAALAILLLVSASAAQTIPVVYGLAEIASGDTPVTLLIVPDGSGPPLTQVRTETGEILDGTITVTLLDYQYNPINMYPGEDIWLESQDGGMEFCYSGPTNPDHDTDHNGQTTWSQPLFAGGWSQALTVVNVNGSVLYHEENSELAAVNLQLNSPDINGDRVVDLQDLTEFSADFHGAFQFRSDLCRDGVLNLLDLVVFAEAYGASCP